MQSIIRVFSFLDIEEIKKHLIILDELYGMCASCKTPGIDIKQTKFCPNCKTEFLYATSRFFDKPGVNNNKIIKRIKEFHPDIEILDYKDYQNAVNKKSAENLFNI